MSKLYGIDLNQKITPLMVCDALVICLFKANCAYVGLDIKDKKINKEY